MYLLVIAPGKYWRFDYRFAGRRQTLALGTYPEVSLAKARQRREKARELLAQGLDPWARETRRKADHSGACDEASAVPEASSPPTFVPLAAQAVTILREMHPLTGHGRYVFPSLRTSARPMSDNTVNAALRRMGFTSDETRAHGFRTMARTLMVECLPASHALAMRLERYF
jgi:integrase